MGMQKIDNTSANLFRSSNPWRVVIDLNESCNLKCSYCHISSLYGKNADNSRILPINIFRNILRDADYMKVFDITLTGGEITIMPDFEEYLDLISGLNFSSAQIITNGTRLTSALASRLRNSNIKRVSISLDGLEAANNRGRGEHTWKMIWKGLENALNAGLNVNVITVLGLHNIDEWYKLSPVLKEMGVRSQNLSLMCRLGRAESATSWQGIPEDRLEEVRVMTHKMENDLNDENFFLSLNDGALHKEGWNGNSMPIHIFQDQNPGIEAVIKVDGSVIRNRVYDKRCSIGNVNLASLSDIWHEDLSNRLSISKTNNCGFSESLPQQYYHYGLDNYQVETPGTRCAFASKDSNRFQIRKEAWGIIEFDTETFSITNIVRRNHG